MTDLLHVVKMRIKIFDLSPCVQMLLSVNVFITFTFNDNYGTVSIYSLYLNFKYFRDISTPASCSGQYRNRTPTVPKNRTNTSHILIFENFYKPYSTPRARGLTEIRFCCRDWQLAEFY